MKTGGGGTSSCGFSGGCVLVISGEVLVVWVVSRKFTREGVVGFWLEKRGRSGLGCLEVTGVRLPGFCSTSFRRDRVVKK